MRVLVTGGNGFVGSFLVEKLLQQGYDVRCLVRQTSNLRWIKHHDVEFFYGELRHAPTLWRAVQDVDIVYHLGGVTRGRKEQDYIDSNFTATVNLLNACRDYGPAQQKFVFVSSQAAGGPSLNGQPLNETEANHPISMYGRSKHMAEQMVFEFAKIRPATIVRPPSVYGPRDTDFFKLFQMTRYGFIPMAGDGRQKISIIHVADLVQGLCLAGTSEKANGQLFFMSSDEQTSFTELVQMISNAMSSKTRVIHLPFGLVAAIAGIAGLVSSFTKKPALIHKDKIVEMKQTAWLCCNRKAKATLGFQPQIGLEEGMKSTALWYKEQGWV